MLAELRALFAETIRRASGADVTRCPYCGVESHWSWQEMAHMRARHPEMIEELTEARMRDAELVDKLIEEP